MKTTVNIPDDTLQEAMRHSGASTKRDAIVIAIEDYNRRKRQQALVTYAGTCDDLMTIEELRGARQRS